MTTAELAQLKAMSPHARISHFFHKFNRGEITKESYDQALKFCSSLEREDKKLEPGNDTRPEAQAVSMPDTDTPQGDFGQYLQKEFGGEIIPCDENAGNRGAGTDSANSQNEPEAKSQKARLLALLSDYCWHDTNEIQLKVYGAEHLGSARISGRTGELKKEGYEIKSRKKDKTVWEYRLINNNKLI